jgi:hypothetical protein
MKILSFGWTADLFLAGKKTMTSRLKCRFKEGELVQAYSKIPCWGGVKIGIIKIRKTFIYKLKDITQEDVIEEGGKWATPQEYIDFMIKKNKKKGITPDTLLWGIKFDVVELYKERE